MLSINDFSEWYALLEDMTLFLMIRTACRVFSILARGKIVHSRLGDILTLTRSSRRVLLSLCCKGRLTACNRLVSRLYWVSFLALDDIDPSLFTRRDLFW